MFVLPKWVTRQMDNKLMKVTILVTSHNLWIIGFLDFIHHPEFKIIENTMFKKLDLFLATGEERERETLTLLGPLE
jgi:hypothetical protein